MTADVYDFDDTTSEKVQTTVAMPDEWNRSTVKAKVYWTTASGTGGVTWGVTMGAASDDDALGAIPGTEVTVDDTRLADNDLHVTAATGAITVGGSPALGDLVLLQVARKPAAANDTKTGDARFLGVMIQYLEGSTEGSSW
jgi:GTPase involved in cell partitioning and DNA repair